MATLIHDSMPKAQDDYLAFHNNTGDFVVYDAQVQQVNGKVVNCRLTFPAHVSKHTSLFEVVADSFSLR